MFGLMTFNSIYTLEITWGTKTNKQTKYLYGIITDVQQSVHKESEQFGKF